MVTIRVVKRWEVTIAVLAVLALVAALFVAPGRAKAQSLDLSLIHISEPTRPY